jgi:N6-L-threonylcarbamoyladenine synthase
VKILAIETSCDETAICLLECTGELPNPHFKVLANSLISQIDLHKKYGGVFPMLAKREHTKNLPILLEKTLKDAGENLENPAIDYIAVTRGPGLEPALWTGILFAEELSKKWQKPLIPVNHMEGHIWSVLLDTTEAIQFPALALLVSGGHTELVLVKSFKEFEIIGKTRDDAVGEAFDKAARILGLEYPGGPKISLLAQKHREKGLTPSFVFPQPMLHSKDLDFSYSGLKTSVLYKTREMGVLSEEDKEELAHAFEDAAIGVLIQKTRHALENLGTPTLIVGGGVSANAYLQKELHALAEERNTTLLMPPKVLTTDNAVMIGIAAYVMHETDRVDTKNAQTPLQASGNLSF